MPVVAELISYPIKGCAGVTLTEAPLESAGLPHDRSFMIVNESGVFRSQRRDPRLARIRPQVSADGARLTLRAPGTADLAIEIDLDSPARNVTLFGTGYRGIDQGAHAAAWLSELLGTPSRLVHVPKDHERVVAGWISGNAHYADSSPMHLISRASLDDLNRRLAERGEPPLPMARFRPNLVVDGWAEPYLEDQVRHLGIGNAELGYAKPAIRCAVTLVDQRTGGKAGPEPLRTLATYRRAPQGGVAFGVKLSVITPGKLAVGDEITISAWGDPEL